MHFPNSGAGRPYCRIDGRSGAFALSTADGDPESVEMRGKVLDLDLAKAKQGWLMLSVAGADWVPLAAADDWSGTPRPSPDHNPAVEIDVYSPTWPEPRVRQLRGSSKCITGLIARIADAAGEVPSDRAVRVKITGARIVKVGKGTSAEVQFALAPREKWPLRAFFEYARPEAEPEPEPAKAAPAKPGSDVDGFADLEDANEWT